MRAWLTDKEADPYFYSILIVSFILFTIEIFVNCLINGEYQYSFFFYLDIVATLSLIPDIKWVYDLFGAIIGARPSYESVNVYAGEVSYVSFHSHSSK